MIYGALLWMADKLQSDWGEPARTRWAAKGKQAFEDDCRSGLVMVVATLPTMARWWR
jgi:Conjugal transfer protein TraD